jgi:hypothetical protein
MSEAINSVQLYAKVQQENIRKQQELDANGSAKLRVYTCNLQAAGYVFKNGKRAQFMPNTEGINCYTTDIPSEQQELDMEITYRHPNFAVYAGEVKPLIEPMEVLKARFFAEFEANQKAALNPDNNAGNYTQTALKVATTRSISSGAAGSMSEGTAAVVQTK